MFNRLLSWIALKLPIREAQLHISARNSLAIIVTRTKWFNLKGPSLYKKSLDPQELHTTAEYLRSIGIKVTVINCDVTGCPEITDELLSQLP